MTPPNPPTLDLEAQPTQRESRLLSLEARAQRMRTHGAAGFVDIGLGDLESLIQDARELERLKAEAAEWQRKAEFAAEQYRRRNGEAQKLETEAAQLRAAAKAHERDWREHIERSAGEVAIAHYERNTAEQERDSLRSELHAAKQELESRATAFVELLQIHEVLAPYKHSAEESHLDAAHRLDSELQAARERLVGEANECGPCIRSELHTAAVQLWDALASMQAQFERDAELICALWSVYHTLDDEKAKLAIGPLLGKHAGKTIAAYWNAPALAAQPGEKQPAWKYAGIDLNPEHFETYAPGEKEQENMATKYQRHPVEKHFQDLESFPEKLRRSMDELVDRSSLGTPEAKTIRAQTDKATVDAVLKRADELAAVTGDSAAAGECPCGSGSPLSYEGPLRDCWRHGTVRKPVEAAGGGALRARAIEAQLEMLREHVRFGDKAHLAIANTIAELERQLESAKAGGG